MAVFGVFGCYRHAIGARRFFQHVLLYRGCDTSSRGVVVELSQALEADGLYITSDRSLSEAQGHPRLEMCDHTRVHSWMVREIKVEAVGPRGHQLLQPRGRDSEVLLQILRVDEHFHPQVLPDR